jgi:hypothetical protein
MNRPIMAAPVMRGTARVYQLLSTPGQTDIWKSKAGAYATGSAAGMQRVVPQNYCSDKPDGTACGVLGDGICINGWCH